jgi:hypothetical protein
MNESIARLRAIFRENSVQGFRSLRDLTPKARDRLDSSVYSWFYSFKTTHIDILANGLNLCLAINKTVADQLLGDPMETAVKKLSFFSQTAVLLTPKFRHPGCRGKLIPDAWYYLTLAYMPLLEAGLLAILPKGMTYLEQTPSIQGETFIVLDREPLNVEKTWFLFEDEIPSLKIVDLSKEALRRQILETQPNSGLVQEPAAYMYLPHLSSVPLDIMVLLRQYHGDLFSRYNRTIKDFFTSTSKAKTEKRLLELMQETDDAIRTIDAELEKISSAKALQAYGIALKLGAAALCPLVPKLGLAALPLIGGNVLSDGIRYLQLSKEAKLVRETSPFYFPWLVHSETKKFTPAAA